MTGPAGTLPPPSPSTRFTPAAPPPPPAGAPTRGVVGHLFRPLIEARTWKGTAHLLLNLFFGIVWFTLIITGLSVGFGSLITLIGIPVLIGTLLFGRVIGAVERARCRWLLDTAVASPFHPLGGTGSLWDRFKAIIGDGAAWKALAFGLVSLPFGVLTFVVTVVLWSVGLTGVTFPLYGWALSQGEGGLQLGLAERVVVSVLYGLLGLGVLVATPYIVRAMAAVNRLLVTGLLGPSGSAELQRRVEELSGSRDASVDAAEAERRRIERDLHDGAQQRLVALAMDLGLAKDRLERGEDVTTTTALVGQAHDEAKRAITELRELVRGIHPAVLADRGLDAALSSLAARCPVPVNLEVALSERLPAPIETTAYFVVAEALTNVAKHSRASTAWVRVAAHGPSMTVEVTDDGVGGAAVERAGGLAGLVDRVRAVEGTLRLASPPGGPTTLLVELPCGS